MGELPASRADVLAWVRERAPWAQGDASPIRGGRGAAEDALEALDVVAYGRTRNALDGAVLRIGPYIRHGVLGLARVRDRGLEAGRDADAFVQQLAWRDYFQRVYRQHPDWIWEDVEPYKTGWKASDYHDSLPDDLREGRTGVAAIDAFVAELSGTGYLHNHARLYLASYTVHWRRVRWQVGARWFLEHLLDGDPASNNLSWQWVASTFANKPYFFNLDNLERFAGREVNTRYRDNKPLAGSYEDVRARLFPHAKGDW